MAECTFACPRCNQRSIVQTYGGMSDIHSMNCTNCPICIHIELYDPTYMGVFMRYLGSDDRINAELEAMLKPCTCGGTFKSAAPYRCPTCLAPLARDEVVKHIDAKVGFLVMSRAVEASHYWKEPKTELTLGDRAMTKVRVGQAIAGQWTRVIGGLVNKK